MRWFGVYNKKIISGILPQHNANITVAKMKILGISKIIFLPNMRIIDKLVADNRLIISTKFLRILADSINEPLLPTISNIQEKTRCKEFSAVLLDIVEYISYGNNFSAAICRHKEYFDKMLIAQVTIGEKTGNLPGILTSILAQREQKIATIKTLKTNLAYPIFLLVVASSILITFTMLVIPTIYDAIANLNLAKAPNLMTLLSIATLLENWFPVGAKLITILISCYAFYPKHHQNSTCNTVAKYYIQKMIYYTPIIHKFYQLAFISFFAGNLAMLLKANIDITSAFDLLISLEKNSYLASKLKQTKALILKGFNLSNALTVMPSDFIANLHAAEVANTVTSSLAHIAKNHTSELEENISIYSKLMEPAIIVLAAFIIGSILISVYVPLLSIAEIM